jgi:hypothetical protein
VPVPLLSQPAELLWLAKACVSHKTSAAEVYEDTLLVAVKNTTPNQHSKTNNSGFVSALQTQDSTRPSSKHHSLHQHEHTSRQMNDQ